IRAANMQGTARLIADLGISAFRERDITVPLPNGTLGARVYEPTQSRRGAVLLVSGLHPSGINEPRLVKLARDLAADRLVVVTPDIPELSRFEIMPAITDIIEHASVWLASH